MRVENKASWSDPGDELLARARQVKVMGHGCCTNILTYNVFAFPTLGYVAQVLPPPPAVLRREFEIV
eukprot:594987-Pyramimonas_sp.AAC.1